MGRTSEFIADFNWFPQDGSEIEDIIVYHSLHILNFFPWIFDKTLVNISDFLKKNNISFPKVKWMDGTSFLVLSTCSQMQFKNLRIFGKSEIALEITGFIFDVQGVHQDVVSASVRI